MTRGLKNNNPGNIRHDKDKWRGEVIPSRDTAFKQFESMAWGYRAMFHLINNYNRLHGCDTVRKIINRWAPPNENNTEAYVASVCKWSGTTHDGRISTTNKDIMFPIVSAMVRVETGKVGDLADMETGWELFLKHKS